MATAPTLTDQDLQAFGANSVPEGGGRIEFRGEEGFLDPNGDIFELIEGPQAPEGMVQPGPQRVPLSERLSIARPKRTGPASVFDRFGELSAEEKVIAADGLVARQEQQNKISTEIRGLNRKSRTLRDAQADVQTGATDLRDDAVKRFRFADRQPRSRKGSFAAAQARKDAEKTLKQSGDLQRESSSMDSQLQQFGTQVRELLGQRRTAGNDKVDTAALKIQEKRESESQAQAKSGSRAFILQARNSGIAATKVRNAFNEFRSFAPDGIRVNVDSQGQLTIFDKDEGIPLGTAQLEERLREKGTTASIRAFIKLRDAVAKDITEKAKLDNLITLDLTDKIPTGFSPEEWIVQVNKQVHSGVSKTEAIFKLKEAARVESALIGQ